MASRPATAVPMSGALQASDLSGLGLADIARMAQERKLLPVEKWDPPHCGDSLMRIARDGTWFHEGRPIDRPAMVRLFASILRREPDGGFVLVTPVEKLSIEVEDAPFLAVETRSEGEGRARSIAFRLNTGDVVIAGPDHGLRLEPAGDGPHPYLTVRAGLEALLARPVYYELAEIALAESAPGIWSGGTFFSLDAEA
jgi:uncharacterized protein